jgi:hypothetical protein
VETRKRVQAEARCDDRQSKVKDTIFHESPPAKRKRRVAAPTAFISYSWDSDEHKEWVQDLGIRLRRNGVDVRLDRWDVKPGQSLTQFMETQVTKCDFILVICTPNYCKRSTKRAGGVGYEQQIISGQLAGGIARERFIPIVREGDFKPGKKCSIPAQFFGVYAVDMRSSAPIDSAFEQLVRVIHGVPLLLRPDLGSNPFEKTRHSSRLRLATFDLDGYELVSGVAQNTRHPKTFHIPTDEERNALTSGHIAKLMFEIGVSREDNLCERMWVIVDQREGPYYVGRLDNQPVARLKNLKVGSPITFLPEHIIDIEMAKAKGSAQLSKRR